MRYIYEVCLIQHACADVKGSLVTTDLCLPVSSHSLQDSNGIYLICTYNNGPSLASRTGIDNYRSVVLLKDPP